MDETSVYLEFPSNYTYSTKGARKVKANTTGAERTRISAGFTAEADGSNFESCDITSQFNLHNDDIGCFEDYQDCVNDGVYSRNVDQRTASPSVASSTPVDTSTPSVELSQMSLSNERINSAQTSNSNTSFSSPSVTSQATESIQEQFSQSSSSNQIINSAQISSLNTN
ncbi:unnamed protein product [Brachionus calyciflorus]|uniref:Uncharacterized protein n=1 Tax=Brachionus calyciflorus TaxID=104777 RepID=A0A814F4Z8_9BILA|nr:unnamed protein product [Brachionus calyciflorus]